MARERDLNEWRLHYFRYDEKTMCGRPRGKVQNWTDDGYTFSDSDNQCQSCALAAERDDERIMEQERRAQDAPRSIDRQTWLEDGCE